MCGGLSRTRAPFSGAVRLLACGLFLLAAAAGLGAAGSLRAASSEGGGDYPPPPFLPPKGHPRVYFSAKDLPRILENVGKPQNAKAWEVHVESVREGTDGVLPRPRSNGATNASSGVLAIIESQAFDYALRGNGDSGRKAVAAMRNYLRTVEFPKTDYNNAGQCVFTAGAVYDWCYPLMAAEDREAIIEGTLRTAAKLEVGWPPVQQGNVTGHGPEGQLHRDLLCAAVAMYDERPDIYRVVAGRIFDRLLKARFFMYQSHMHPQGNHYSDYRFQWEMLCTWIFDRMGLPLVQGPDQHYVPYWILYARRPDGQILRDGDNHNNNARAGTYDSSASREMFLAANYFDDPYLKAEAIRERPDLAPSVPSGNQGLDSTEWLVFNNPDLEGRPFAELPLSHYFPSPKGGMIARTGWDDGLRSSAVVVEFKINEWYFANHQHLDAGAFQIYYHGSLATDAGYYQAGDYGDARKSDAAANNGNTGYGSLYDINYNKRSISKNVIVVRDPAERFVSKRWNDTPMANDGGQRFPNRWEEPGELSDLLDPKNGYRIGEVLGHGFGPNAVKPDYTYLKGDLRMAYSSKIRAYERSFFFLNLKQPGHPAALVVFDRVVSANPAFKKVWLLHGLEEPSVSGNRTVFRDTRSGYTGKLPVDTVLPDAPDLQIEKVGGPGRENWVDGTAYKATLVRTGNNEGGGWRIEVSPKAARETDYFLNVLQVGDHTPDMAPLPVEPILTGTHAGVRLADRVALFAKGRDRTRELVTFAFGGVVACQVLVADLEAGRWSVLREGRVVSEAVVSGDEGTAVFNGTPGAYELRYQGDTRSPGH